MQSLPFNGFDDCMHRIPLKPNDETFVCKNGSASAVYESSPER